MPRAKKQLYLFDAEHVSRDNAKDLLAEIDNTYDVDSWWMDDIFTNVFKLIVHCSEAKANALRDKIWAINGGSECKMIVTDFVELDQYM